MFLRHQEDRRRLRSQRSGHSPALAESRRNSDKTGRRLVGPQPLRSQWERFRTLAPGAEKEGRKCPSRIWNVLRRVPVVQCVENLLDVDKTVKGVTNLVGSILNPLTELKCASLNPQSTLDDIMKPLDQLCPGLGQTLITVKQDIMKLPAELQKVAEKTSVGALVGERLDSLSLALSRLVGTLGGIPLNVIRIINRPASAVGGGGGLLAV
ncbi:uncharacterized protein [Eleutherodactylus coqui]|uniref:uncharacterized protein isoform X4 n=1 Tax=Eleutherodactylus coqui TaxID=57060 RepID=UPI0034618D04